MSWAEMGTMQLAEAPRETPCVLALGAVEPHGPHLPVGTGRLRPIVEEGDPAAETAS